MDEQQKFQADVQNVSTRVEDELISPIQGYAYKNASSCFFSRLKRNDRQACVQAALNPASQVYHLISGDDLRQHFNI